MASAKVSSGTVARARLLVDDKASDGFRLANGSQRYAHSNSSSGGSGDARKASDQVFVDCELQKTAAVQKSRRSQFKLQSKKNS